MMEGLKWKHAFKLDPDKTISDEDLELICESGSDGIIVGGSSGVTFDNTIDLLSRVRRFAIPCVLEVSNREAIVPGFDHYYVPLVLNATDPNWIIRPHMEAVKEFGTLLSWHDVTLVGYCVLNPYSTVAKLTSSDTDLGADDVLAYGRLAKHLIKCDTFYIEYSGSFGDMNLVSKVYQQLKKEENIHFLYGGGVCNAETSREASRVADTVVVGNVIYHDIKAALETVREVKQT